MSAARWGRGEEEPSVAKMSPGPHRLPRDVVRDNQRRRILIAALDAFGEKGFAATTVKDLIRGAHVSRATFYEVFADKEDCFGDLHEEVLAWLAEEVSLAVAGSADWADQVRLAVQRTVRLLAEDSRLATVCAVEGPVIRVARVRAQHERAVERLCDGLRAGRASCHRGEELPEVVELALVYGAIHMVGRSIVQRQGPDPATLEAELPLLMLIPYTD